MNKIKNFFCDSYGLNGFGIIAVTLSISIVVFSLVGMLTYKQSCIQATIFNKINDTSWTCSDFWWASDQINSNTQTVNLHTK